jgi:uncharacterized tellurite resistance protein B-like protein
VWLKILPGHSIIGITGWRNTEHTMIKQIINQVVDAISAPQTDDIDGENREAALRSATAVLLLEVARADHVFDESEFECVLELVEKHFGMSPEDAAKLVNAADDKAEDLVSLHEFTQLLHNNLQESEKARIVGLLWQVAYADGRLDKYEDSLVRKISDLLHVSRGRSMRLKYDAEQTAG